MSGRTGTGDTVSGTLDHDGRLESLELALNLRCTPDPGHLAWAVFEQALSPAQSAGGRVRLRLRRVTPKVVARHWRGRADLDVDARYDVHHLAGTVAADVRVDTGTGHTRCRVARVGFTLDASS